METDFLNFHDEEHFGTGLYQSDLLDDSQSSLLDIVGDAYGRQDSREYIDHSVIWEQDVESELNGDMAVIPMSSHIDSFPKLSNSPPSKDFQRIFCDWQHLAAIETSPAEDLTADLHLPAQTLGVDMLDCFTPPTPTVPLPAEPASPMAVDKPEPVPSLPHFDFSAAAIKVEPSFESEPRFKKKEPGGKNLALLKQAQSSDELDNLSDNFDITSYVNGDDAFLLVEEVRPEHTPYPRQLAGCYEKHMPELEAEAPRKAVHEDSEEDCIDVETVSEQMPVLQARDLTSLLEQFEASEAVNPKLPQSLFEEQQPETRPAPEPKARKATVQDKPKQLVRDSLPLELLQKIKASGAKKPIAVIPAQPSKKPRGHRPQEPGRKHTGRKLPGPASESYHLDHDYCSMSPVRAAPAARRNSADAPEPAAARRDAGDAKPAPLIDDTAIRIGQQIKHAISSEKQKLAWQQPTVKNADGKLMVSLLKANSRPPHLAQLHGSTVVNTTNAHDEQVQNIIVVSAQQQQQQQDEVQRKKRKLNLEEYKRLRGDVIKAAGGDSSRTSSPGDSGANSPRPDAKEKAAEERYQELMMKMASDILKTSAKARPAACDATLEEFVPPSAVRADAKPPPEQPPATPPRTDYEMRTIVSIGVNTDDAPQPQLSAILQTASASIHSNSLIANITATLLQHAPQQQQQGALEDAAQHGEDKTVIILDKNVNKPETRSIAVQTEAVEERPVRQYRARRDSSASSTASVASVRSKGGRKGSAGRRASHHISSSNSISSSLGSRWSRSRSRSSSAYSQSSYSSDSSRSVSPARRWHTDRNSRSRHRYNRSRRRSRSSGYRANYKRSRSPYSRSRSRLRRERESAERERIREVEERRVIYVGKITDDTTKSDLRRRFQGFGPITNVSVHFRDHGDNYGFVTFAYKVDAYEAVERGNDDPNVPKYDISFGGRRAFCKTRYSDLDNIEAEALTPAPIFRRDEDSFDILLREVQAKLRKRKV